MTSKTPAFGFRPATDEEIAEENTHKSIEETLNKFQEKLSTIAFAYEEKTGIAVEEEMMNTLSTILEERDRFAQQQVQEAVGEIADRTERMRILWMWKHRNILVPHRHPHHPPVQEIRR